MAGALAPGGRDVHRGQGDRGGVLTVWRGSRGEDRPALPRAAEALHALPNGPVGADRAEAWFTGPLPGA